MTRTTNARIAGFTFILYIALAFPAMVLFGRAASGRGTAAKLEGIAQHAGSVRAVVVLSLLTCFTALVLAVTLYRITRDEDADLALLAMACRVAEGVVNAMYVLVTLGLVWLATAAGPSGPEPAAAHALGGYFFRVQGWSTTIGATFFAVGSTLFAWLLLRGRTIPVPLAWLGVVASVLLVLGLPAQLVGLIRSPVSDVMWLPMALFELVLGPWLMIKGVPERRA